MILCNETNRINRNVVIWLLEKTSTRWSDGKYFGGTTTTAGLVVSWTERSAFVCLDKLGLEQDVQLLANRRGSHLQGERNGGCCGRSAVE